MNISDFKEKFSGQSVFIVGRGPSLRDFDFSKISGRIAFAHNDAVLSFHAMVWFVTDNVVIERCRAMPDRPTWIVAGARCRNTIRAHKLEKITALVDTCYFNKPLPAGEWIHSQFTGITGCLYLAWLARASVAYLLGVDAWAYRNQYYFDPKQRHPNRALERDVHHWIDKDRFVAKVHVDRHIPALRACASWLASHADEHRMDVVNLSIDSQHDVFSKRDWRKFFDGEKSY